MTATLAAVTVTATHKALERTLYADLIASVDDLAPDALDGSNAAAFEQEMGRLPRCREELDAFSDGDAEHAAYQAAHPVVSAPTPAVAAPTVDLSAAVAMLAKLPADALAQLVATLQAKPTVPAPRRLVPAAPATPADTTDVAVKAMTPTQLREDIARKFGFNPPVSWNAEQLRACRLGWAGAHPHRKEECQLAAYKLRGYYAPKSWSCKDIWEYAHGRKDQRGKGFKTQAVAKYAKAFGVDAAIPKSWTATRIDAAVVAGVAGKPGISRPGTGGFAAKRADGLTADKCRKLITDAINSGRIKAEQAKGRSAWKADQLREFVTQFNLHVGA